jgi:tRNA (guanine-N7-)-methyltransferase
MSLNLPIRSFMRRERRMSKERTLKFAELWARYGLEMKDGFFDSQKVFGRSAPLILEIGFGQGETLLFDAKQHPEKNYLGIEVYRPGVEVVLKELAKQNLMNVRIYRDDALLVLPNSIIDKSLDEVRLFFPDPWPKRSHHKRRLVRLEFIKLLANKLKAHGYFHFVTDWQDYAEHVLKIVAKEPKFIRVENTELNLPYLETKFAKRGIKSGRQIYALSFQLMN